MADRKFMLTSELPDAFFRIASHIIHWHSTGLVRISQRPGQQDQADLIGSGTLIQVGNNFGILTAQHVAELLKSDFDLGVILIEGVHRPVVDRSWIDVFEIAVPRKYAEGPDLAFIRIPEEKIREFRSYKGIFDLTSVRDEMLTNPPDLHQAVWFVNGIPDEWTAVDPNDNQFDIVLSFHGLCGAGGANDVYDKDGFDYIESIVEYMPDVSLPNSFGGISGGGVWQVPYVGEFPDDIKPARYILAGLPFAQSPIKYGERTIYSHGWKSIYEFAYDEIMVKYS